MITFESLDVTFASMSPWDTG